LAGLSQSREDQMGGSTACASTPQSSTDSG